jgi:protein involved in sex pheromone biosynthesis
MKKTIMILAVAPILIINACNNPTSNSEKTESTATTTTPAKDTASFQAMDTTKLAKGAMYYQCSMHPEVITDKPGDCPKCGMKLVMMHKSN